MASIPSLRPLVTRTLSDYKNYRSQHQIKRSNNGSESSKDPKARVWPKRGRSSASKGNHLVFDDIEMNSAGSFPSANDYDIRIPTRGRREPRWTPLSVADNGIAEVRLPDFQGIQINQEIEISQA